MGDGPYRSSFLPRPNEEREGSFDVHRLVNIFRRRKVVFFGVAVSIVAAAVCVTIAKVPIYVATAQLVIEPGHRDLADVTSALSGTPADSTTVDTQVEVLRSPAITQNVIAKLGLDRDPEFNPALWPPSLASKIERKIAGVFGGGAKPAAGQTRALDRAPDDQRFGGLSPDPLEEQIIRIVNAHLNVQRAGVTYLINVSYASADPVKAARIANAYVEQYMKAEQAAKLQSTREANLLLSSRIDDLRQQVQQAKSAVEAYKDEHNLLSTGPTTLTEQDMQNLTQQYAAARDKVTADEARLEIAKSQLARGGTGEDLAEALASPVVQNLRAQLAVVSRSIADLRSSYGEAFPDVQKALRQEAALKAELRAEVNRIVANLQTQVDVARQNRDELSENLEKARERLTQNNQAQVKLNELEQNALALNNLYLSFVTRLKETGNTEGLEQTDARLVSPANVPATPSSPKLALNLALGFTLAFAAGCAAVALCEVLEHSLSTGEDIVRTLDVPHLPAIPSLASTLPRNRQELRPPAEYILKYPFSGFAEAFRTLRASLLGAGRTGSKVVAITSSLPGEGKTTVSICLGRVLGMAGASVVVVDCDMRRRGINRIFTEHPRTGLIELLEGKAKLDHVLQLDPESGAYFLPLARTRNTPKDIFGTDAMDKVLQRLREEFEIVILDTPPVLAMADTRVLAPKADMVIMLAHWRQTPRKAVQAALHSLQSVGAKIAGVSLTRVDQRKQAEHGYGDAGHYYRAYEKYYRS